MAFQSGRLGDKLHNEGEKIPGGNVNKRPQGINSDSATPFNLLRRKTTFFSFSYRNDDSRERADRSLDPGAAQALSLVLSLVRDVRGLCHLRGTASLRARREQKRIHFGERAHSRQPQVAENGNGEWKMHVLFSDQILDSLSG